MLSFFPVILEMSVKRSTSFGCGQRPVFSVGRDAIVLTSLRTFASPVGNSAISNTPSFLASPSFTSKWRKTSTLNLKDSILPLEEVGYRGRDVLLDSGGLVEHRARGQQDLDDVLDLCRPFSYGRCWSKLLARCSFGSISTYFRDKLRLTVDSHNGQQFHRRLTP